MRFEKWQALGNDYLIVEADEIPFELTPARVRRLCDSHFGAGGDGVLLLARSADPEHVADLRIFNPDGSEAELSGNGAREAIMYLRRRGWTDRDEFTINTIAGTIRPRITGPDTCRVDMGKASLTSKDFPGGPDDGVDAVIEGGDENGRLRPFRHVSIGNPQCAIHVDSLTELEGLDLSSIGPPIEADARFPNRTNVSWFTELEPASADAGATIRARIFERGVGETLSSGTGAVGAAVAYVLERRGHMLERSGHALERSGHALERRGQRTTDGMPAGDTPGATVVRVVLDGGELEVAVGEDLTIELTGWARPVLMGTLSDELQEELHETE